jgi:serine/threonine protein kinase
LLSEELKLKDYFSKEFSDLLHRLLEKKEVARLSLRDARNHPFFKKIDWEKMESGENLKAPIKPASATKNIMKVTEKHVLEVKKDALEADENAKNVD